MKSKQWIVRAGVWSCHTEMGRHLAQTLVSQEKAYKDLQDSTGNSTQYFVMTYMGKHLRKVAICICITDLLYCTPESNTTLGINYNKKSF